MRPPPPGTETGERLVRLSGEPEMSSTSTSTCNQLYTCRWRPYSNSNLEANVALVLIILFCGLVCSLALNAALRCFLRGSEGDRRRPRYSRNDNDVDEDNNTAEARDQELEPQRKLVTGAAATLMVAAPIMIYSTGLKLAGTEAECAICLSEFVEGEGIQVLAKCNHGFHVQCIQQWLFSKPSCPTCRCSCLAPSPSSSSEENTGNSSQPAVLVPEP